jgi:hypothetical protein
MQGVFADKQLRTAHLLMLCCVPLYCYLGFKMLISLPHWLVYVAWGLIVLELLYFPATYRSLARMLSAANEDDPLARAKIQTRIYSLFSSGTITGVAAWILQVSGESAYWGIYLIAVTMLLSAGAILYLPVGAPRS